MYIKFKKGFNYYFKVNSIVSVILIVVSTVIGSSENFNETECESENGEEFPCLQNSDTTFQGGPDGISLENQNLTDDGDNSLPKQPFPYALSATYLTFLAGKEAKVYAEMGKYAEALEERLRLIRKYMTDYESSSGKTRVNSEDGSQKEAEEAVEHPLVAYRMVRRFANEFTDVVEHLGQDLDRQLDDVVIEASGEYGWPSTNDWHDGIEALLRLHYMYDLDLNKFANGKIGKQDTGIGLPTAQVFEIAQYAAEHEYFTLAKDWLDLTETRLQQESNETSGVSLIDLATAVQKNIQLHDEKYDSEGEGEFTFEDALSTSGNVSTVREIRMGGLASELESLTEDTEGGLKWYAREIKKKELEQYTFIGLCNGDNYQSEAVKKELSCWYATPSHYFGPINPLKMELLSKEPWLLQIYEVIGDDWIEYLKESALPTLERAPPPGDIPGVTYRTAAYAWLHDNEIPETPISRRIELITNLNVRGEVASEDLQIASYAYGGHVALHLDSLGATTADERLEIMGNRITTFLIYLNEVKEGGYTAFPILKTHVKPVKGSAVMWYTSLRNGETDDRMLHGACPIIYGHKWIGTKWTNLNKNFLNRPCALDPYI